MAIRVIQWATGPIGGAQLREIIGNPAFELAGVLVYSPAKAGRDAGEILGLPPTGILATDDRAAILALDADVVLHSASKAYGSDVNTDDIVALLASGKNVITSVSYAHLKTLGGDIEARIAQACERGGTRFHAAGEHPGFLFERLAVVMTGLSHRVDSILLRQFVDCSGVTEEKMLVDLMGMGKAPDEISDASPAFRAVSLQAEQALAAGADALGLEIDETRRSIRVATMAEDLPLACTTLKAGTVVGQILSWSACRGGVPLLTCEEYWSCADIPGWEKASDGQVVRITLEGVPRMELELVVDTAPVAEFGGLPAGYIAVAMSSVRAIPYVLEAPVGIVVPRMFGAYRWPRA